MKNFKTKLGIALMAFMLLFSSTANALTSTDRYPIENHFPNSIVITKQNLGADEKAVPATGVEDTDPPGTAVPGVTFVIEQVPLNANGVYDPDPTETDGWLTADPWVGQGPSGGTANGSGYSAVTDQNGQITFGDLPYGRYKITEILKAGDTFIPANEKFYIDIPTQMHTVNADDEDKYLWIYDVYVYPKSAEEKDGAIEKRLVLEGEADQKIKPNGNKYEWEFTVTVPEKMHTTKPEVTITDKLDKRLNILKPANDVVVQYKAADGTMQKMKQNDDYNLVYDPTTKLKPDADNILTITFTDAGTATLRTIPDKKLYINITTYIVGNIDNGGSKFLVNGGTLKWIDDEDKLVPREIPEDPKPNPNKPFDPKPEDPTKPPYSDTGDYEITKVDANTGTKLPGARFQVFATKEDAEALENPLLNPVSGDHYWTSDTGGKVTIAGLQRSYMNGNEIVYIPYYLVETTAPEGYNLMHGFQEFKLDTPKDGKFTADVENKQGFTLPPTGGRGTIVFTVVGLSLITVAGLTLIVYRKHKNEEE